MHTIHGWAGLRLAGLALAFGLLGTTSTASASATDSTDDVTTQGTVPASPLFLFSSTGNILDTAETSTISDGNLLSFNPILQQIVRSPSNVSLGEFQVLPNLAPGVSTTYTKTPFQLSLTVGQVGTDLDHLAEPIPNETPIFINGWLDGTITGQTQSSVTATFDLDPDNLPTFRVGDYIATITKLDPVDIAPFTTNGGRTSIQARIVAEQMVPEPASIAVFLVALAGGLGLRRRALARKGA